MERATGEELERATGYTDKKKKKKYFALITYRKRNRKEYTVNNVDMQRRPYCCKQSFTGNLCRQDLQQENGIVPRNL
ncbi:jg17428 [Pararge aegeria aegeria]|uniref:Jg17428 protein n=1 Tax=Pararge aegeria aegeria TaxID=348720 RepID=A0A8S4S192_9NEOP|nr:jg17428 [Pararge aegeria aegeria]